MVDKGPSYAFLVEWYDHMAYLVKRFTLIFHTGINSVEMHDEKSNRLFLKCTKVDNLKISDFYLGASITVLARTLKIIDYANTFTRDSLQTSSERCLVFIRPAAVCNAGKIIERLEKNSFRLVNLKMICPTTEEVRELITSTVDHATYPKLLSELSGKGVLVVEVIRQNAFACINEIVYGVPACEPHDPLANSEMFVLGHDPQVSHAHAKLIFGNPGGPNFQGVPNLKNTTLALIKPHAVADGLLGSIWSAIQARRFCITAARLFRLSKMDASEFLEVYKGVANEYPEMLEHLASGPCVALEIFDPAEPESGNIQQIFREFVGPVDPEIARYLRPETLRAKFGVDKIRNAVHCTDLPDDSELEVNFFFQILDK